MVFPVILHMQTALNVIVSLLCQYSVHLCFESRLFIGEHLGETQKVPAEGLVMAYQFGGSGLVHFLCFISGVLHLCGMIETMESCAHI